MCAMREPNWSLSSRTSENSQAPRVENEANFANCIPRRRIQLSKSHDIVSQPCRQSLSAVRQRRDFSLTLQLVRWTRALEKNSLRSSAWLGNKCARRRALCTCIFPIECEHWLSCLLIRPPEFPFCLFPPWPVSPITQAQRERDARGKNAYTNFLNAVSHTDRRSTSLAYFCGGQKRAMWLKFLAR